MTKKPHGNARHCKVCLHDQRWRIELLRAGGASLDALAAKFDIARDSIWRHWTRHVSVELKATYLAGPTRLQDLASRAADTGVSVLDNLNSVRVQLAGHLANATEAGDGKGAAYIAGRLVATLETIAKISGELGVMARSHVQVVNTTVNFTASPHFARLQAMLMNRLAAHPAALDSVLDGLRELETIDGGNAGPVTQGPMKLIEHGNAHGSP
jgi:hypothetical protein